LEKRAECGRQATSLGVTPLRDSGLIPPKCDSSATGRVGGRSG
jgi:hypothetical protein